MKSNPRYRACQNSFLSFKITIEPVYYCVSEYRNFREKKISLAAYIGFHLIWSQDPKDFLAGTSVDGWNLHWKLDLFVWFLWWLCKKEVLKNLPQSVQSSVLLGYWFYSTQNALKCLKLISYAWQQPPQADFFCFGTFFCKST